MAAVTGRPMGLSRGHVMVSVQLAGWTSTPQQMASGIVDAVRERQPVSDLDAARIEGSFYGALFRISERDLEEPTAAPLL